MNRPAPVYGLRVDFSSIANTNSPVAEGVLIRDVESGSAADRKYKDLLERGRWIITTVNGKPVSAPADFYREVAAAKGGALDLKIVEAARYSETPARTLTFP
jgi:S1-C subfamily serine protease